MIIIPIQSKSTVINVIAVIPRVRIPQMTAILIEKRMKISR